MHANAIIRFIFQTDQSHWSAEVVTEGPDRQEDELVGDCHKPGGM